MAGHNQSGWTFLSNHSHVLVCLWRDSGMRMRELAQAVGVTERAIQRIVADLTEAGAISKCKEGRVNHYEVNLDFALRHPLESHATVRDLIGAVASSPNSDHVAEPQSRAS